MITSKPTITSGSRLIGTSSKIWMLVSLQKIMKMNKSQVSSSTWYSSQTSSPKIESSVKASLLSFSLMLPANFSNITKCIWITIEHWWTCQRSHRSWRTMRYWTGSRYSKMVFWRWMKTRSSRPKKSNMCRTQRMTSLMWLGRVNRFLKNKSACFWNLVNAFRFSNPSSSTFWRKKKTM